MQGKAEKGNRGNPTSRRVSQQFRGVPFKTSVIAAQQKTPLNNGDLHRCLHQQDFTTMHGTRQPYLSTTGTCTRAHLLLSAQQITDPEAPEDVEKDWNPSMAQLSQL